MNENNFSVCKKLFSHTDHHQLVYTTFFAFLSNLNCQEQSVTMQQTEKKENAFPSREFVLRH